MTTKSRFALLVPLCLILLTGCGSKKKGTLSGNVTYNGAPVTGGTIEFHPEEGGTYISPISPDGTFSVPQLPKGEYTVTVETESINPKNKQQSQQDYERVKGHRPMKSPTPAEMKDRRPVGGGSPHPPGAGGDAAPTGEYKWISPKYGDKKTSDQKVTVTGGSQKWDAVLEGPAGPPKKGR